MSAELRRVRTRSRESLLAFAALGLVSFAAKLDRLVDAGLPGTRGTDAGTDGLYFLLGLVAAKERIGGLLDELAPPLPRERPAVDAEPSCIDRSLFR